MTRSPIFLFVAVAGSVYAYQRFVNPMPSNKSA